MGGQLCRYLRHLPPGVRRNRASRAGESENGPQLCRYLRHLRPRGPGNRPSRSSGRQIGPDLEGNGTGVSAISESKARVFGGFREEVAIFPERGGKRQRTSRGFRPELAAPERN